MRAPVSFHSGNPPPPRRGDSLCPGIRRNRGKSDLPHDWLASLRSCQSVPRMAQSDCPHYPPCPDYATTSPGIPPFPHIETPLRCPFSLLIERSEDKVNNTHTFQPTIVLFETGALRPIFFMTPLPRFYLACLVFNRFGPAPRSFADLSGPTAGGSSLGASRDPPTPRSPLVDSIPTF